ncbi:MAG: efflux RND transporter periplasmic adaptor subunit [Candidatus Binatia bacterium]
MRLERKRFIVPVLGALLVAGCAGSPATSESEEASAPPPRLVRTGDGAELLELRADAVPGMTVATVGEVELPKTLETSGQVTFDDRRVATIIARVGGRVEAVNVSQWDSVKQGQPIVALYSPDYMTAEAEYLQALKTSQLNTQPALSDHSLLASAMVAAARRKLELLGLDKSDIDAIKTPSPTVVMRAPISGVVTEKQVMRGSQVNPGDVLFTLGMLDEVWITADIYEADLARVHAGQELQAVPIAFPDQVFKGVITRISPDIDPNTHTLQIRCQVRNPDLRLKPQMFARVRVVTTPGTALVVPQQALVFETDGYYAFVQVAPDKVSRRRVVVTSWNEQGYARVLSGLTAGERVIQAESIQANALWHQAHGESS